MQPLSEMNTQWAHARGGTLSAIVSVVTKVGATYLERFNSLRRFCFTGCCLAMIIRKNVTPLALSNQTALTYSLFVFFS